MVSAWAPDGALDVFARVIGQKLHEQWGQSVIVGPTWAGTGGNVVIDLSAVARASIVESRHHERSLLQFCVYLLNTVEHREQIGSKRVDVTC